MLWSWEPATGPRTPKKIKVAQKWLESDFRGTPPKVAQKWPQKWLFDPKRDSKVTFSGQKVTFGVTFELFWGSPPKVTFQSLLGYSDFFQGSGACSRFPRSQHYPKHLLRQNFPSEGKLGEFSLRGNIFPLRDNFPLPMAFPFPQNAQFSLEMKGLRKRSFYGLRENWWLSPRGKIYLKPFFCLKRCYG